MRTALGIVIGLAARAEVTLFDEPYAGLDAVARQLFYDRLLAEYVEHPRTFLLSTHLIDEAADLLERVVMVDHGRVVLDAVADDVRGAATTVSGPTATVEAFVAGRQVWERRRIAAAGVSRYRGDARRRRPGAGPGLAPGPPAPLAAAGSGPRGRAGQPGSQRKDIRMKTLVNVARYHLVDRLTYIVLPWALLAFVFAVNLVIVAMITTGTNRSVPVGGLSSFYVMILVAGVLSTTRSFPFALSLGVSRRSYFLGTAGLAAAMAAVYGLALTVLQVIERATGGWGIRLHFFRVGYLLPGPWYLTWLTSFVGLTLVFVYGSWFGLVYRRWNITGLLGFIAGQITVLLAGALIATWAGRVAERGPLLHDSQRGGADRRTGGRRGRIIRRGVGHDPPSGGLSNAWPLSGLAPSPTLWTVSYARANKQSKTIQRLTGEILHQVVDHLTGVVLDPVDKS